MTAVPDMVSLMPADAQPRVLTAREWQALRRLHADIERARAQWSKARGERASSCERALQEQREAGYQEGLARASEELVEVSAALRRAQREQQRELVGLMMAALEQLLGELPHGLVTASSARAALARIADEACAIAVVVHPSVLEEVREQLREWRQGADTPGVDVRASDALARCDCDIETRAGTVRAGLKGQLDALRRALENASAVERA